MMTTSDIASCLASAASWHKHAANLREHARAAQHLTPAQSKALLREAAAADRQADWWQAAAGVDVSDDDDDDATMFRNHYECDDCGHVWSDDWSAQCDDDCPECGARHMSPFKSEDLDENGDVLAPGASDTP